MSDRGDPSIEATGETVGEAKWNALRELERLHPGLDMTAVRFQVVSEGERGILGVGYAPARVVATVPEEAIGEVPEESEEAAQVRELLERVAEALGIAARIAIDEDGETIRAAVDGQELGALIGRHGQTIDAVQFLANAIAARRGEERKRVVVDAAGYRARRQATLEALAARVARRVAETGEAVPLEPMSSVERRIVHVALKEFPGVETESEGTEPSRRVVVLPARD